MKIIKPSVKSNVGILALYSWGCMMFVLPFSTSLALLFSLLATLLSVIGLKLGAVKDAAKLPSLIICVLLFFWILTSAAWSLAPNDELIEGVFKYRKLIFVPLVAISIYVAPKDPEFIFKFFLAGCFSVALVSIGIRFHVFDTILGPQTSEAGWDLGGTKGHSWFHLGGHKNPTVGRNHISQGAFLVFSGYFLWALVLERFSKNYREGLAWSASLMLVAFTLWFAVFGLQGRTGYLLTFLSAFILLVATLTANRMHFLKVHLLIVSVFVGTGATLAVTSHNFLQRSTDAVQEVLAYQSEDPQGQGVRLSWWIFGMKVATDAPVVGHGAGSFPELYSRDSTQREKLRDSRAQPHSEPVLQLVHGGAVALILYIGIFFAPIMALWRDFDYWQLVRWGGLLFLIFVHGLYNSALWDLAEGHYLVVLLGITSGILLKARRRANEEREIGACRPKSSHLANS